MSDRKYSQRGYQDDGRPRERSGGGPRPPKEGPRNRGLGAPTTPVFRCRDCGAEQSLSEEVAVDTVCDGCGAGLHSCVNCAHLDTAATFECRKPIAHRLASKTKPNDCAHFAKKVTTESDGKGGSAPDDPRAAFDALFR